MKNSIKTVLLLIVLLQLTLFSFSQEINNKANTTNFSGAITATNNGISIIPTFSLNKPAAIFDMSAEKGRFSFDPELGFSLEGKPWTFLFWLRYKLKKEGKFKIHVGTHYGLAFSSVPIITNGISTETITAQRYLAGEFSPNYFISKNVRVGIYYLYAKGLDSYAIQNTHFLTLNTTFSNIKLSNQYCINFTPQFYYLNLNGIDGFYFTSTLSLIKKNFPFSISYQTNKVIKTNIAGSPNFVWNIGLIYSLGGK